MHTNVEYCGPSFVCVSRMHEQTLEGLMMGVTENARRQVTMIGALQIARSCQAALGQRCSSVGAPIHHSHRVLACTMPLAC